MYTHSLRKENVKCQQMRVFVVVCIQWQRVNFFILLPPNYNNIDTRRQFTYKNLTNIILCGCVCVCVGFVICGCFANICTCIYCLFVLFSLYKYIYIYLFIYSYLLLVYWLLPPSENSIAVNNKNNNTLQKICGCFDNCVGVLVICVLVFTVFCIVSPMYIYSYLLLV